jgi:hypothetical protein
MESCKGRTIESIGPHHLTRAKSDSAASERGEFYELPADLLNGGWRFAHTLGLRALEFERQFDLRAICLDLSLPIELHVEFGDFCDTKVAKRFGSLFDRVSGSLFPGVAAGAD